MRVLFINSVCGTGSTGRIVVNLWRAVQERGGEGRIIYGVGNAPGLLNGTAVRFSGRLDYYAHNALSRLTDHAGRYSKAATRRMIRYIQDFEPELIHLHTLHGYYVNTDLLFSFLSDYGRPVVWTLHDCWPFTGHCTHFSNAGCTQWKTGCRSSCPQLRRYPKCVLRGDAARNYARKKASFLSVPDLTLTAPSEWLSHTIRDSFLGVRPVLTIPNGIDTACFSPRPGAVRERLGLEDRKIVVGVASVWNRQKGLEDLAKLAERLPDPWRLVLVGIREEQKNKLPDSVLTIGRTDSQEALAELYSAADVFVNPSYEETMGLTTAEALACGTPAVVYDQTAVPELVDERSGLVVPAGDIDALCRAVVNCSLDREDVRKRGEQYSLQRQNEAFLTLYERLIGARS